jgi:hypothetical protein
MLSYVFTILPHTPSVPEHNLPISFQNYPTDTITNKPLQICKDHKIYLGTTVTNRIKIVQIVRVSGSLELLSKNTKKLPQTSLKLWGTKGMLNF